MNRKSIRLATLTALAAASVAVAAPMASAAERHHAVEARNTQQTEQVQQAQDQIDLLAAIDEDGFEERLLALPSNPSPQQVAEAMYPGNEAAQEAALPLLVNTPQAPAASHLDGGVQYGWWDTTKRVTACIGAVGAFVAGNGLLVTKAAKFGGVIKGAKLIAQAGNSTERWKLAVAIFGDISGISGVVKACGG
ncbi:hypothetical protein ACIQM4_28760 [Streptomyces sp. NPDC091272]|uniref:hypothetical protein n=1 Tax=Streptomyces sp. NPDC091272 TaxID=3365981 RepID=UPI003820AEC7